MPGFRTHIFFGFLCTCFQYVFFSYEFHFTLLTLVYSIFPDIDSPTSKMRQYYLIITCLFLIIFLFTNQIAIAFVLLLLTLSIFLSRHRGFFHTWYAALILSLPILFVSIQSFSIALVAYMSHILLDRLFTK